MTDFGKYQTIIDGEDLVKIVVLRLIVASQWFEVMPMPDDQWRITVKDEEYPVALIKEIE